MENKEKFEKLMQDEDFITGLLELQTPEEVKEEFKSNGVEMSSDEVNEVIHELDTVVGLVADEELENVSGGGPNWEKFKGKFIESSADSLGKFVWIIPTVALTTVVSTVVAHYIKKKLEKDEKSGK